MEYIIDVMVSSFTWVMFIQLYKHIIHPWMFFMCHLGMTSFHMKGRVVPLMAMQNESWVLN